MSLFSFANAYSLQSGLFFYDIFWVFATDVMVTVAKNFDAPVKLLFPRDIFATPLQHSMLGLGDIVIPGIFLALLLRFDHKIARNKQSGRFAKPYFTTGFIAYILGLVTTIFVMHTFKAAQVMLILHLGAIYCGWNVCSMYLLFLLFLLHFTSSSSCFTS